MGKFLLLLLVRHNIHALFRLLFRDCFNCLCSLLSNRSLLEMRPFVSKKLSKQIRKGRKKMKCMVSHLVLIFELFVCFFGFSTFWLIVISCTLCFKLNYFILIISQRTFVGVLALIMLCNRGKLLVYFWVAQYWCNLFTINNHCTHLRSITCRWNSFQWV